MHLAKAIVCSQEKKKPSHSSHMRPKHTRFYTSNLTNKNKNSAFTLQDEGFTNSGPSEVLPEGPFAGARPGSVTAPGVEGLGVVVPPPSNGDGAGDGPNEISLLTTVGGAMRGGN